MYNKLTLAGNVGKDPEIRSMQNGNQVARFSLATSESWKDKNGQKQTKTEWHQVVCFNPGLVGVIERFVKKGTKLLIEAKSQTRSYEQDGVTKYATEAVIPNFGGALVMLGDSGNQQGGNQGGGQQNGGYNQSPNNGGGGQQGGGGFGNNNQSSGFGGGGDFDDDIPF